jgi:enamine deaminase RidA (YjgF/YER057c/UK114 family)
MSTSKIEHINPDNLIKNPAFTNVITVSNPAKTIYVGEQNSNNAKGEVVGKGDLKVQTIQVLKNVEAALKAAGAGFDNVIKWTIYLVEGQSLQEGFEGFQQVWGKRPNPPVVTALFVASLANPDYLLGIEAVAVL